MLNNLCELHDVYAFSDTFSRPVQIFFHPFLEIFTFFDRIDSGRLMFGDQVQNLYKIDWNAVERLALGYLVIFDTVNG